MNATATVPEQCIRLGHLYVPTGVALEPACLRCAEPEPTP